MDVADYRNGTSGKAEREAERPEAGSF